MPKVSIVVPVYNVEQYLRQCIDSLVNQTLKDIEIIFINDSSTDNSLAILEEYAEKDTRIKIITQENQGQGVARNKGIDIATGEYIAFVDSDDWVELNMYEELYKSAIENDCDYVLCDFYKYMQKDGNIVPHSVENRLKCYGVNFPGNSKYSYEDIKKVVFRKLYNFTVNYLYKTSFVKENNIKYATYRKSEDNVFSIKVKILGRGYYLNKALYYYRIHNLSTCRTIAMPIDLLNADVKNLLLELNVYEELKPYFDEYCADNYYLGYTLRSDRKYRKEYEEKYKKYLDKEQCKYLEKKIKKYKKKEFKKFISLIFSLKNIYYDGQKIKQLCVLGLKLRFKKRS